MRRALMTLLRRKPLPQPIRERPMLAGGATGTLTLRSARRRGLDERLARYDDRVGSPPLTGWIRAIREALGMSQFELGQRMGVSQPRVAQIERAEAKGLVELATIARTAAALGCSLRYVLVPEQSLEEMVCQQALDKAGGDLAAAAALVDAVGLWGSGQPVRRPARWAPEEGA
jgi:predicted DNA-binding mobile mystery protein A